jgi:hypothetical protein
LVGVSLSSGQQIGRALSIFGGGAYSAPPNEKSGLNRFLERNPIYEDELELKDCIPDGMEADLANPAGSPNRFSRIWKTTATKMRTTYESWLKSKDVPLWMRRSIMGHKSETTTMTSYGSERVSLGIRQRQLNNLLNEVEQKIFKGQLLRWEDAVAAARKALKGNVVQIFSHLMCDIFVCENPMMPTWPGHEIYVVGHCTEFDECLFCEQCMITVDSLPVLIRWFNDLKDMQKLVGPVGISDKLNLRKQAIEEVFDLCRNGGQEWRQALEKAYETEMDPAFTAPDFTYRLHAMSREGK